MSRVDKWALTVVLVIMALVFPFRAWWDFRYPENWSPGSMYDPHIYLWAWAATAILIGWIAWRIVSLERNRMRRWRVKVLLVRAEVVAIGCLDDVVDE